MALAEAKELLRRVLAGWIVELIGKRVN